MNFEKISQKIEVVMIFKKDEAVPYFLKWNNRHYKIEKVNMVNKFWRGETLFYHFYVSDDANTFKLLFDTETLIWRLEEVYSE